MSRLTSVHDSILIYPDIKRAAFGFCFCVGTMIRDCAFYVSEAPHDEQRRSCVSNIYTDIPHLKSMVYKLRDKLHEYPLDHTNLSDDFTVEDYLTWTDEDYVNWKLTNE